MKNLRIFLKALLFIFLSLLITIFIGINIDNPNLEGTLPSGEKIIVQGENTYINYGFPFKFWTVCSGFCGDGHLFNYFYFFIDFVIWFVAISLIYYFIKKLIKHRKNKNNFSQQT